MIKLDLHIIELPKIKGLDKQEKDKLMEWLIFLNNPNDERMNKIMAENKAIKEAVKKLEVMSNDGEIRRIAELREKAVRDEKATYSKGVEDGIEKGIEKGEINKAIEIAKNLLNIGLSVEQIEKSTGLSKEEIESLINKRK